MKKGDIIKGDITAMAYGGKGILKIDGLVIFVQGAILGEYIEAKITKKKKDMAEAKLVKVINPSPLEQKNNYQPTPGAPWMKLPSDTQIKIKRELVFDLFFKFAKVDLSLFFDEFLESPQNWFYRNKMEYSFGPTDETSETLEDGSKKWSHSGFGLGSKKRGQFWLVDSLQNPSGIFDEDFEKRIPEIQEWCKKTGLGAYNQRIHKGFFRHLVVRKSFYEEKFLVNIVTNKDTEKKFNHEAFIELFTKSTLKEKIHGIYWTQHDGVGDTANSNENQKLIWGQKSFIEQMSDLKFQVSLHSFFQPNIFSAELVYKKAIEYADLKDGQNALDLFCGTGTIAQILAKSNPKSHITGVDIIKSSISDANKNAVRNSIKNISFYAEDAYAFLKNQESPFDVIIVDPPRAGITPKALQKIIETNTPRLVYVSCNPSTMARDIGELKRNGYQLENFSLVDQFPHTPHIECIAKLKKV